MCCDAERVARLEKEAQSLKRVSEEVFRVQKQIDSEKLARESASGQLQSDLQQLLSRLPATTSPCMKNTSYLHVLDNPVFAQSCGVYLLWLDSCILSQCAFAVIDDGMCTVKPLG